ncbi:MAG: hypothetical protein HC833_11190 [Leptolyngbyaceae cyanobacterium RM1_406_9]|nr:hypothetical protein [Leptolyngbyaceae cyanobacterium SM1_4_3]NJO74262.1 hypothetical protein [Leptolyngbyaceae cyanobacterium RM1_406_9]
MVPTVCRHFLRGDRPWVHPTFAALTLNSSPRAGEGLPIRLPFSLFERRGWGMRANLQNLDAPIALLPQWKYV